MYIEYQIIAQYITPAFSLSLLNSITEELINSMLVKDIIPPIVQGAVRKVKEEKLYEQMNFLVQTKKPFQDHFSRDSKGLVHAVDTSLKRTNKEKYE